MTDIDNVNNCLSTASDPYSQTNCIGAGLGYPSIITTSETNTPAPSDNLAALAGIGAIVIAIILLSGE